MSPVHSTVRSLGRALGSFHPAAMPVVTRRHYRRELMAWLLLPVMLGAVEGGVVSVIAKNAFAGVVTERWLNIAVAVLTGAPAFANVSSFLWASISHGRDKIRMLVGLQLTAVVLVASVALAPQSPAGLLLLTVAAVGTRVCWTGVVTLRSTVWRANYPRPVRARMAGKLATVQALMLGASGLSIGVAMRAHEQSYHLLYPIAAAFGVAGAIAYARMRMRGHAAMLQAERRDLGSGSASINVRGMVSILRDDPLFRRYMIVMFLFGLGNIMVTAPLVIVLHDLFGYGYLAGILITSTIPTLMIPITVPLWSRLLDRTHIIRFRTYHCWAFVATTTMILVALATRQPSLLWIAAALKGVAIGGGVLGWNLGHHDFAPLELTSQYMGVHVTLTGIRGVIGPTAAVALYELLAPLDQQTGAGVFVVCLVLNLLGAAAFAMLNRSWRRLVEERDAGPKGER